MGTTSKHSWSRRDFLKGAAAGTMSVAALGALGVVLYSPQNFRFQP